jgi:hypothetical protein
VTPYGPGHDLHPFALVSAFKYFFDCLQNQGVGSFNCSVGLWVVHRCEGDLCLDLMTKILEHGTIKILGVVNGDLLWNSIVTNDVQPEEFLDGGGGYVGDRLCFNPFGEILHHDNGEGVLSLCCYKFMNDIDAPPLKGAKMGQSTVKVLQEPWSNERISDKLCRLILVWLHHRLMSSNRILTRGP